MDLKLKKMVIENFKATKFLEVSFGQETRIAGRNGIGKTTIADAFFWTLLGKDSHGNAPGTNSFREKPLDAEGKEQHNLTTAVELVCTLDGKPFTLKRSQSEKWEKKRGAAESVFTGNASAYWINGVETKASDYKAAVSAICADETVFGYIAMLGAFNAADPKVKRKLLLDLVDGDAANRLLASPEYQTLADEVQERGVGVDGLKKILTDALKLQNAELKMLPVRIDEAKRMIPDFKDFEVADAKETIAHGEEKLAALDRQIAAAMASDPSAALAERIADCERKINERRTELSSKHLTALCEWRAKIAKAEDALTAATNAHVRATSTVQRAETRLRAAKETTARLRDKWRAVNAEDFHAPEVADICPACHQVIPEELRAQTLANARMAFNAEKAAKLAEINRQGKEAAAESDALNKAFEDASQDARLAENEVRELEEVLAQAKAEQPAPQPDMTMDERLTALETERDALLKSRTEGASVSDLTALRQQRAEASMAMDAAKDVLARYNACRESKARVAELEARQRGLGDEAANTERKLMLLENFQRERCSMLEESISGHFPGVRWKLFDQQINGGIAEVCVCMVPCGGGYVPYNAANTASQLVADLEIIDTLSKRYDASLPVFFDNRERVNALPPVEGQLITLSVTTDDPMKVEIVKE